MQKESLGNLPEKGKTDVWFVVDYLKREYFGVLYNAQIPDCFWFLLNGKNIKRLLLREQFHL